MGVQPMLKLQDAQIKISEISHSNLTGGTHLHPHHPDQGPLHHHSQGPGLHGLGSERKPGKKGKKKTKMVGELRGLLSPELKAKALSISWWFWSPGAVFHN